MAGAKGSMAATGNPPEFEQAIQTMVENYEKYSSRGGFWRKKRHGINTSNFRKMLSHEMHHMLEKTENKTLADKMRDELDENGDKVIDFDEYWNLIGQMVSLAAHVVKQERAKDDGR